MAILQVFAFVLHLTKGFALVSNEIMVSFHVLVIGARRGSVHLDTAVMTEYEEEGGGFAWQAWSDVVQCSQRAGSTCSSYC